MRVRRLTLVFSTIAFRQFPVSPVLPTKEFLSPTSPLYMAEQGVLAMKTRWPGQKGRQAGNPNIAYFNAAG